MNSPLGSDIRFISYRYERPSEITIERLSFYLVLGTGRDWGLPHTDLAQYYPFHNLHIGEVPEIYAGYIKICDDVCVVSEGGSDTMNIEYDVELDKSLNSRFKLDWIANPIRALFPLIVNEVLSHSMIGFI